MQKKSLEELRQELQEIVNRHNQAQTILKEWEKSFIQLTAIIKDRTPPESDA